MSTRRKQPEPTPSEAMGVMTLAELVLAIEEQSGAGHPEQPMELPGEVWAAMLRLARGGA